METSHIFSLAKRYNAIQEDMGKTCADGSQRRDWMEDIDDLFSVHFTKTANGFVLVDKRERLVSQIQNCLEDFGPWSIEETYIIPSADHKNCTLRYIITTEKEGRFDVIALLTSKDGVHIDAVDEVYYQMT